MWALIQDGLVLEATDIDPDGRYHPDLKWQACESEVRAGWLFENGAFVEPFETLEQLTSAERQWRDAELAARQWLRDRHGDEQDLDRETTLSAEQFAELLTYLQDLRDWPQSDQFPVVEHRPVAPSWIADQSQ
ncbi:phage tail assembly chaperone [Pseudomonas sp.]|uniref:phage tail assembly chaperone n=1 Tax=Pseudomonas sp. TaxID=306 RepID=UPI0028A13DAE|nr:phage tail assembly chaperone [Pseudomonas sp.]